jgi:hypothetical protein
VKWETKAKLRARIAELEERLRAKDELVTRYLNALEEEDSTTAARILVRVHGESS